MNTYKEQRALAEFHASKAVQHAINAGRMLLQAQKLMSESEFKVWVKENIPCGYDTCLEYMEVAKNEC